MRKTISKRLRFEIFKRDSFTCQYCSSKPPKVPLEIDHIIAVSKGGTNEEENLITACFDCNRGKSNVELSSLPETVLTKTEKLKLAQLQYREFLKIRKKEKEIKNALINEVEDIYSRFFPDYEFAERFKISVKTFIDKLGIEEVNESMEVACSKLRLNESKVLKYFCGICWNKIKEL